MSKKLGLFMKTIIVPSCQLKKTKNKNFRARSNLDSQHATHLCKQSEHSAGVHL